MLEVGSSSRTLRHRVTTRYFVVSARPCGYSFEKIATTRTTLIDSTTGAAARPTRAAPARICTFCKMATARMGPDGRVTSSASTVADYRFILRGSKGPFPDREPAQLYARACVQGWPGTCGI